MHIYSIVSIILLLMFILEQNSSLRIRKMLFYIASFIVVSLLAFRGNDVGGDTINYCGYFSGKGGTYGTFELNDTFEIGFRVVCWILMQISRNDFWFLFSTSLITMIPFIYLINRDCKSSKILPLCLYMNVWGIISVTQTAIRQNISVTFFIIAYIIYTSNEVNLKKKIISVVLLLVCGFFTHTSSLVALPLVVCATLMPLNKKLAYIITIGSFALVMVFKNLFSDIFDIFNSLMLNVEFASHMLDVYYENDRYSLDSEVSFNRLAPATLLVCILIRMSDDKDMKSPYLKFLVLGGALYNIGATFPMIFRTLYALLFLGIIYTPSNISKYKSKLSGVLLILLIAFFIRNQVAYLKPNQDDHMLPYTFIWE